MNSNEKQILRRLMIAGWKLLKSEQLTEAIEHIDEIVEAVSDLQEEEPAPEPPPVSTEASAYRSGMTTNRKKP